MKKWNYTTIELNDLLEKIEFKKQSKRENFEYWIRKNKTIRH